MKIQSQITMRIFLYVVSLKGFICIVSVFVLTYLPCYTSQLTHRFSAWARRLGLLHYRVQRMIMCLIAWFCNRLFMLCYVDKWFNKRTECVWHCLSPLLYLLCSVWVALQRCCTPMKGQLRPYPKSVWLIQTCSCSLPQMCTIVTLVFSDRGEKTKNIVRQNFANQRVVVWLYIECILWLRESEIWLHA